MPKQVDHAARREEIAQAALRLCARDGLAGVTIGQVAQEAGVSKGLVQHYFAGKADLLRASAQVLRGEIERQVRDAVRDAHGPAETLRCVLLAIVELGVTAVVPLLAGHAFLSMAVADPEIRALYRAGGDGVHREIAALLAAAGPAPDVDPGGGPRTARSRAWPRRRRAARGTRRRRRGRDRRPSPRPDPARGPGPLRRSFPVAGLRVTTSVGCRSSVVGHRVAGDGVRARPRRPGHPLARVTRSRGRPGSPPYRPGRPLFRSGRHW